jgi:V/A-type H+-transporting ATPase subunit E
MSQEELIASLLRETEEKISGIRDSSRAEIDRIRAETSEQLDKLRDEYRRRATVSSVKHERAILFETERKGALLRLSAENALAERLRALALSNLQRLRDGRYPAVFSALVKELPSCAWEVVKVNSIDLQLAREHFPATEKVSDDSISGGLEVIAGAGAIRVINTFEKRLERGFDDLLPIMMRDIYSEM